MKGTSTKTLFFQIFICALFLGQPVLLSTSPPEETGFQFSRPTQRDFAANGLMLLFFYLHFFVIIPRLYFTRKFLLYGLAVAAGLVVISFLPSLFTGRYPGEVRRETIPNRAPPAGAGPVHQQPAGSTFLDEIKHHIFLYASVILFSLMLQIRNRLLASESARHQAELASLKAQINPHFLFNTLNTIYALAVIKDDRAAGAVMNLSEIMRYIIRDAKDNQIPLAKELDYIRNYIDLQRSRLGNTAVIHFSASEDVQGNTIAPLILISFIENAFKYGINPDVPSEVAIHIGIDAGTLSLLAGNCKVSAGKDIFSSGIGIENTKERLNLLYSGRHQLSITEDEHTYTVHLSINLL